MSRNSSCVLLCHLQLKVNGTADLAETMAWSGSIQTEVIVSFMEIFKSEWKFSLWLWWPWTVEPTLAICHGLHLQIWPCGMIPSHILLPFTESVWNWLNMFKGALKFLSNYCLFLHHDAFKSDTWWAAKSWGESMDFNGTSMAVSLCWFGTSVALTGCKHCKDQKRSAFVMVANWNLNALPRRKTEELLTGLHSWLQVCSLLESW